MTQSQIFVGLDVGTSAVRCVVGMLDEELQAPSVIGVGVAQNHGMRKGTVLHVDDVAAAITEAVGEAERVSGQQIQSVTVNVNGAHVQSEESKGVVAISGIGREITEEDRLRVEDAAAVIQLPANRDILQVFAKRYRIDGQDNIKDPIGMQGVRLEVDTQIVTAGTPLVRNLELALEKAGLYINNKTVSSIAAAEAVLDRRQKESGTAVIDFGAGTTNIVVIEEGEIECVSVLPVGSINLTNDLAIGLKTDLSVAELVKKKYLSLEGDSSFQNVSVTVDKKEYIFQISEIRMIAEARVEEMFELIDKEFKKIGRSKKLPGGVVIVGGMARLPGIADVAKEALQLPAKIGSVTKMPGLSEKIIHHPEFSTATGLMLLDMLLGAQSHGHQGKTVVGTKFFQKVNFKKLFRS